MEEFELSNKVVWRKNVNQDTTESFYPSFIKDIHKKSSYFEENFRVEFVRAGTEKMKTLFLPLYASEIMGREDFALDRNTIENELLKKIDGNDTYTLMCVYHGNDLVSGMLFSLKENMLHLGYRATKKDFDKKTKHGATISYWGEKIIFEYGKKIGANAFSYGKDTHPFHGKNIGRPLYKLKTGMKPRVPLSTSNFSFMKINDYHLLEKKLPVFFFDNPDKDGFYKECHLYSPKETLNDSYLKEFESVTSWAGLQFHFTAY